MDDRLPCFLVVLNKSSFVSILEVDTSVMLLIVVIEEVADVMVSLPYSKEKRQFHEIEFLQSTIIIIHFLISMIESNLIKL